MTKKVGVAPVAASTHVSVTSVPSAVPTRPVGGSGGGAVVTVMSAVRVVVSAPSLTVTLIVVCPTCSATGVSVSVRVPPEPLIARLAFGSSVWLDELAVTTRFAADVASSLTVSVSVRVVVSSVVKSETPLSVGG